MIKVVPKGKSELNCGPGKDLKNGTTLARQRSAWKKMCYYFSSDIEGKGIWRK